jgi:hypothetical protein
MEAKTIFTFDIATAGDHIKTAFSIIAARTRPKLIWTLKQRARRRPRRLPRSRYSAFAKEKAKIGLPRWKNTRRPALSRRASAHLLSRR